MPAQDRIEVDRRSLTLLVRALRREADGKAMARDLIKEQRVVAQPALEAVRAAILSMPSISTVAPGLRQTVARKTRISVRTTGRRAGVSIRALKTGMPREFKNAPKRLNARQGWRHPVFGNRDRWVSQVGKPGWFDDTLTAQRPAIIRAVSRVLEHAANRISATTRG
jgi:hypothetical protein